jgi:flagellar basal-body rod modification protein FlgD
VIETNNPQPALRQANTSLNNAIQGNNPGSDSLGKEDFLNLLMAQVTHQDPLNPMDSQGMMDQLTSMGSLEQLVNLNKQMGRLNATQGEIARTNAYAFLDKDVSVRGGNARVTAGATGELRFQLSRPAEEVHVFITDTRGEPVRTLALGQAGSGSHRIPWDAQDEKGEAVADGTYRYKVVAKSVDGESVPVEMFTRGRVAGVTFKEGRPIMIMDGEQIDPRDIVEISNLSQRVFGGREARPLQEEIVPKPPAVSKPE